MTSIFQRAPISFPVKHTCNKMLPPLCFTVGMAFFGWKLHPCSSIHCANRYGQTVRFFVSSEQRSRLQNAGDHLQTSIWLFHVSHRVGASSLYNSLSGHGDIRLSEWWMLINRYPMPPTSLLFYWVSVELFKPKFVCTLELHYTTFLN